jgi:hypothetical protein
VSHFLCFTLVSHTVSLLVVSYGFPLALAAGPSSVAGYSFTSTAVTSGGVAVDFKATVGGPVSPTPGPRVITSATGLFHVDPASSTVQSLTLTLDTPLDTGGAFTVTFADPLPAGVTLEDGNVAVRLHPAFSVCCVAHCLHSVWVTSRGAAPTGNASPARVLPNHDLHCALHAGWCWRWELCHLAGAHRHVHGHCCTRECVGHQRASLTRHPSTRFEPLRVASFLSVSPFRRRFFSSSSSSSSSSYFVSPPPSGCSGFGFRFPPTSHLPLTPPSCSRGAAGCNCHRRHRWGHTHSQLCHGFSTCRCLLPPSPPAPMPHTHV